MPSDIRLIDPVFKNKFAVKHSLLVDIDNGYSCTIVEQDTQIIRGIIEKKSNSNSLQKDLEKEDMLDLNFGNTSICLKNIPFCLTPNSLFTEDKRKMLLAPLTDIPDDYKVSHNELVNIPAKAVFAYPAIYDKLFNSLFKKKIVSYSSLLADFTAIEYKKYGTNQLILNIEKNYFTLVIYNEKGLQLCNDFNYSSNEDFAYYLLFSLEQNNINAADIHLKCMGKTQDEKLFSLLREFIPKISFYDYSEQPFKKSKTLDRLNQSQLFAKTLPLLCV